MALRSAILPRSLGVRDRLKCGRLFQSSFKISFEFRATICDEDLRRSEVSKPRLLVGNPRGHGRQLHPGSDESNYLKISAMANEIKEVVYGSVERDLKYITPDDAIKLIRSRESGSPVSARPGVRRAIRTLVLVADVFQHLGTRASGAQHTNERIGTRMSEVDMCTIDLRSISRR